jgi:hypothetical protein
MEDHRLRTEVVLGDAPIVRGDDDEPPFANHEPQVGSAQSDNAPAGHYSPIAACSGAVMSRQRFPTPMYSLDERNAGHRHDTPWQSGAVRAIAA